MTRIVFLDRDGVLLEEPADEQVDSYAKFKLVPGVIPALLRLRDAGFEFVMVTNQDGLGTPAFPRADFEGPQRLLLDILASQGIALREVLVDTHRPQDDHPDRKLLCGPLLFVLCDEPCRSAMVRCVTDLTPQSTAKNASSCTSTWLRFVRRVAIDALPIIPWSARYSHAVVTCSIPYVFAKCASISVAERASPTSRRWSSSGAKSDDARFAR